MPQEKNCISHSPLSKEQKETLLTEEAQKFIVHLHKLFNKKRLELLEQRKEKQKNFDMGQTPSSLKETSYIRGGLWFAPSPPSDLQNRRVEITGPTDRKMIINALNSGANVFMADLEDSLSPSWQNILDGHINLQRAIRRTIDFTSEHGKSYKLKKQLATLIVRPRGWHLNEKNMHVNGTEVSASLFDFALHFFHNAKELIKSGSGPYFYLPKMESHLEARLWNNVFTAAQNYLGIPHGAIRVTVLIETLLAALSIEEIIFELKDHICGLNAGRWDYIFSFIKNFSNHKNKSLPDRENITMTVPFMKAYTEKLVYACHKHNIHAIGGMSAFIPSRNNPEINKKALAAVGIDKKREAENGFDGTWVAHPDLVKVAADEFEKILGSEKHQKHVVPKVKNEDSPLLSSKINHGEATLKGFQTNIAIALEYIENWLCGLGAVGINHMMEDAATAEISRAQLWQWIRNKVALSCGTVVSKDLYNSVKKQEKSKLEKATNRKYEEAEKVLDDIVLNQDFVEFFTLIAYKKLDKNNTIQI